MTTIVLAGQALACFILFSPLTLAAIQTVYVDDAVLTGAAVPTYLPSSSSWSQGNGCSGCLAKPDPALAYDGTWHDTTFAPNSTLDQSFEFTFMGSGLYIFFILANNVPYCTTFTSVNFILDGVQASTFTHNPSTSTDYEYNQTVYANDSIPYGQHTMHVAPVNDTTNNVLILFDYLIYTVDTDESSSSAATTPTNSASDTSNPVGTDTSSGVTSKGASTVVTTITKNGVTTTSVVVQGPSPSPSPSLASGSVGISSTASSRENLGAIVGGTVAGAGGVVGVLVFLFYYRRYKRRTGGSSSTAETDMVEPFVPPRQVPPTSSEGTSLPSGRSPIGLPSAEVGLWKTVASPVTARPATTESTITDTAPTPDSGASSADNTETNEQNIEAGVSSDNVVHPPPPSSRAGAAETLELQVELLRDEVSRLRRLQDQDWNITSSASEPPPAYS